MKHAIYCIPDIGMCHIDYRGETLVRLQLSPDLGSAESGEHSSFSDAVFKQVHEYLAGERKEFEVAVDISNRTPFQQLILRALQAIPYGELRTYKQIAEAIGNPKAVRAVGGACNRNPIQIIIPCHRVVGVKGALTGYAAGLKIKKQLLDLESVK